MKGLAILVSKQRRWIRIFAFFLKTSNNIHMNCKNNDIKTYTMDKYCILQQKLSKILKET